MFKRIVLSFVAILSLVMFGQSTVFAAAPTQANIIAMPHPDDESEVWSLVEGSTADYKVFTYFTRGEQTAYCVPSSYQSAFKPAYGEIAPAVTPTAQFVSSCVEARISSTLNFLNAMQAKDSTIPGGFSRTSYTTVTLPRPATGTMGHIDANGKLIEDRTVRIYKSTNGYGVVLFFNLGDGDLTKNEVTWALQNVISSKASLGIPAALPVYNILGAYYNQYSPECAIYAHPDHYAVHQALYSVKFNITGYRAAATCASDSDTAQTKLVSDAQWDNIWKMNGTTRVGLAQKYYGWEDGNSNGWPISNSTTAQTGTTPFMKMQSFWNVN